MDFGFSDEQRDIRELARQIFSEQVTADRLRAYDEYAEPRFDRDLWQILVDAGLPALAVEERYGGGGFGLMELGLLLEEAGRSIAPLPLVSHCVGGLLPLQRFGSDAQKERWLAPAARGDVLLTAALVEGGSGAHCLPELTTATREGEELVLTGRKLAVPYASQADRILLAARCDNEVALCWLDPSSSGVRLEPCQATSFEPQARLELESVRIPAADVLAWQGGASLLEWLVQRMTVALCCHQLGVADAAMRMAASYTAERQQFGVPVATFQAVGHRMANCYIDVECLRLAGYQACSLLAEEQPATLETRIAKVWAGDVGHRVSYATQHVHGGMGIDRDYPLWRYCLWLRHNEMTLGGSSAQLAAIGAGLAAGEGLFA
ncbi:acyl-CoA dehydrogenase family protein [Parahaliea maris]|uniref:Acyl-CoA dehydrogenase family protein n=1 Tax=Parahaliea maris TaxID=2716870 RepID=A0A5C9A6S5_9GAMM|nr:acyl-CoA dehydrogenase family protein [Parahaliea maris]TXS95672.1 acyl-CoA dehydrogenase family protein [Parahaliea maris]